MNRTHGYLFAALVICLSGCDRLVPKVAPNPPDATPTPEPGFAGTTATTPPVPLETKPAAPAAEEVSAPATINMDAEDAGNRAMRAEVLKRIDVMPNLGEAEKDKLYVQVERARAMGQVITIPFASGEKSISSTSAGSLAKAVALPQIQKFSDDPTVVFVVLGYADKKGDPKSNLGISLQRAEAVVKVLKEKAGVMNVAHAVGMGGSELFDASNLGKNRVVEVWAVLP
jgi:outer membrane protein OmpA-like peptidoglycan-associated protein